MEPMYTVSAGLPCYAFEAIAVVMAFAKCVEISRSPLVYLFRLLDA